MGHSKGRTLSWRSPRFDVDALWEGGAAVFRFVDFPDLQDGEIKLVVRSRDEPNPETGDLPRYGFSIVHIQSHADIGVVYFAVDTTRRQYLKGHLSYAVSPAYSGHNYAAKACRLIRHVALAHGFKRLFIGAQYDNVASSKTIVKLGAAPVTIHDVPDEAILRQLREDEIKMYVWDITQY